MESKIDKKRNKMEDNRAVSPVIGVILMVAITVILAAVIGVFVLDIGNSVADAPPSAQFSVDYADDGSSVNITHEGGDTVDTDDIYVTVDGDTEDDTSSTITVDYGGDSLSSGNSVDITDSDSNLTTDSEIRLIWESSNGDKTTTLFQN